MPTACLVLSGPVWSCLLWGDDQVAKACEADQGAKAVEANGVPMGLATQDTSRHHIGMSRYGRQRSEETCQSGTGGVLKTHLVKQDLLYSQLLCPVAIAQETFAAANQLSGDKCEKSITNIPRSRYVERLCGQGLSMMWLTLQTPKQRSSNSKDNWAVGQ